MKGEGKTKARLTLLKGYTPSDSAEIQKDRYQTELVADFLKVIPLRYESALPNYTTAICSNYLPWLSEKELYVWEVKPSDYDLYSQHLQMLLQKGTVVNYNKYTSNMYDWMLSRKKEEITRLFGVAPVNPIDQWNTPKRNNEEDKLPDLPENEVVNYYIQKEKHELAKALQSSDKRRALILAKQLTAEQLMLRAGLRVEEVSSLDFTDIDLEQMVVIVRDGKGGKDRIVDMSPSLASVMKWFIEEIHPLVTDGKNYGGGKPLFCSERKERLSKKTIYGHCWKQQEIYNVPIDKRFSPHGLRRLYATNLYMVLVEEGHPDPIMYVKWQLGHVYLSTTLKYCRIPKAFLERRRGEATRFINAKLGTSDDNTSDEKLSR